MKSSSENQSHIYLVKRRTALVAIGGALAGASGVVRAQVADSRLRKLFVGFPPGGATDVLARIVADALRSQLDGSLVVENRAGAAGRLAVESLKTASDDGLTMLMTPDVILTIYPHIYRKLAYDPQRDMVPVAQVASYPVWMAVGPAVPASVKTVQDYIQWVKADSNRNSYATPGAGTGNHFIGVMLSEAANAKLSHVPYKGDSPAIQDLLGGHIPMSINVPAALVPNLQGGRIRVLATSGSARSPMAPDVPTFAESGFPSIQTQHWMGIFVSSRTQKTAVKQLETALSHALRSPALVQAFEKQAVTPAFLPGDQFAKQIAQEAAMWGKIVKATGFTIEE